MCKHSHFTALIKYVSPVLNLPSSYPAITANTLVFSALCAGCFRALPVAVLPSGAVGHHQLLA